jgi:hypothetical protein
MRVVSPQIVLFAECTPSAFIFRNNITDGYPAGIDMGATDHNVYTFGCTGNCGDEGGTSYYEDNLSRIFVDPTFDSTDDFQILSSFVGKDVGYNASGYGITDDYAGTSRPKGSGWDIGAYEMNDGRIGAPSNLRIVSQ